MFRLKVKKIGKDGKELGAISVCRLSCGGYFYRLSGALHFAGEALYAVFLSYRVRFFFRKRVSRRFSPLIQRNGANVDAYAVSNAGIPVNSARGSMNAQFLRGLHWSPNFVSVMFADNLAFCLKIRVDRQEIHRLKSAKRQILGFLHEESAQNIFGQLPIV